MTGAVDQAATTTAVHPCVRCGGDAPYDFGEIWLCLDCYHIAGSTCAGINRPASAPETSGSPSDPGVC